MTAIPDWLAKLPANGYINAKEGYSPKTTAHTLIKYGHLPPATTRSGATRSLQYIRRWLREKV